MPQAQETRLAKATIEDLQASSIPTAAITAAGIRDGTDGVTAELLHEKYHVDGYLIPYRTVDGEPSKHYRIKVLASLNGSKPPKYLQPSKTGNHLYVPPGTLLPTEWASDTETDLFITEGEKKALATSAAGFPCVAVGGVFSWRNHKVSFDRKAVHLEEHHSSRSVTLDDEGLRRLNLGVVEEFDQIAWKDRNVYLVFDSDATTNSEVQRAAFELANYLEDQGAQVKQIAVPPGIKGRKQGIDDLIARDPKGARKLLSGGTQAAFRPLPSDAKGWIREQLNSSRSNRATQERVASLAVHWLDANGERFVSEDGTYYYFDLQTRILHDFRPAANLASLRETSFGHLLVAELGLDPADSSTVGRLVGRFPLGAHPISPHRIVANRGDVLYYQLSDAHVARISSERGIEFVANGEDDVLFYSGVAEPLDPDSLLDACENWELGSRRVKGAGGRTHSRSRPLWLEALATLNIEPLSNLTEQETKQLICTLFYISPWLKRWRGLMLPLEIAVAEPNSGKTFLYNLRKGILTGRPTLTGLPDDFRSWVASVGSAPALWVCDNLGNAKSDYWHRLNDEIARLITDPEPGVELRQLYTTARTLRVPVDTAFAITTIKNPFTAPDILQRSIIFNLSAIPTGQRDANWYDRRMADRTKWVAEHLSVLALFLERIEKEWDPHYKSSYRLSHFEQALIHMGAVLGFDMRLTVRNLGAIVADTVASNDPTIEAIVTFLNERRRRDPRIRLQEIVDWVEDDSGARFSALKQFNNIVMLGRYVWSHKYDIEQATGLQVVKDSNATVLKYDEE